MDLCQKIEQLLEGILKSEGYGIVRIVMLGQQRKTLQIMIERLDDKNVGIEDCENVSRLVSPMLDVEDIMPESYYLEVSSPGLDRPLVKVKDFIKFVGHEVIVQTNFAIKNRKKFKGLLESATESAIKIVLDQPNNDQTLDITLSYSDIRSARLYVPY